MANRPKMDQADRAKQFMPFAALKGYEEALAQKEKIVVPKIELSEEMKAELDLQMKHIEKNDIIKIIYFKDGEYLQITGIDVDARVLKVVNTKINFDDIYRIESEL